MLSSERSDALVTNKERTSVARKRAYSKVQVCRLIGRVFVVSAGFDTLPSATATIITITTTIITRGIKVNNNKNHQPINKTNKQTNKGQNKKKTQLYH